MPSPRFRPPMRFWISTLCWASAALFAAWLANKALGRFEAPAVFHMAATYFAIVLVYALRSLARQRGWARRPADFA